MKNQKIEGQRRTKGYLIGKLILLGKYGLVQERRFLLVLSFALFIYFPLDIKYWLVGRNNPAIKDRGRKQVTPLFLNKKALDYRININNRTDRKYHLDVIG
jgi:hypothetical protein